MNNQHLIPTPVKDVGDKIIEISKSGKNNNEKFVLLGRMRAIKQYCEYILKNFD